MSVANKSDVRPFEEFIDSGLLWAINRVLFHPRGYALAFSYDDDDKLIGWLIQGDGDEVWAFDYDTDMEKFPQFEKLLNGSEES
jgi:YD repeat-containing protein